MRWFLACLGLGAVLTGCASAQLNYNTADLASSLGSLQKRQIFYNLAQALDDPNFVPSQVTISIGTAQTANAVNPNLSIPLGSGFASAARITEGGRNAGNQFTGTFTTAATGLGIQLVDSWNQSWTMVPANGSNQLRRLRALYQYATGSFPHVEPGREISEDEAEKAFLCEYPLQALAVPSSPPGDNIVYRLEGCPENGHGPRSRLMYADPNFTQGPNCVICVDDLKSKFPKLYVNPHLKYRFIHSGKDKTDDMVRVGEHGFTFFYVCASQKSNCRRVPQQEPFDGRKAFSDFVLFVYEAMAVPAGGSGSGKSTGGANFVYSVR